MSLLDTALATTFDLEWADLTHTQKVAIRYDCLGGRSDLPVEDYARYRSNIGIGNLARYADVQIGRMRKEIGQAR